MNITPIEYSKVDPWIKKNPESKYPDFMKANPKIKCSSWSFEKRRRKVLKLPLTPSMQKGYKPNKSEGGSTRSSRWVYSTVCTLPVDDLKAKDGITVAQEILGEINKAFKLNLEIAQVNLFGENKQVLEIRRYNR
jgi:hypothetical protein